jgi:hypothetical protein
MAFVEVGIGTAMLYGAAIGAGTGAIYAGATGGNILNGALMGGAGGALLGGGAAGIAGASWAGAGADFIAADVASMTASGLAPAQIAATLQASYGMTAAEAAAAAGASSGAGGALQAASAANTANNLSQTGPAPNVAAGNPAYSPQFPASPSVPSAYTDPYAAQDVMQQARNTDVASQSLTSWDKPVPGVSMVGGIKDFISAHPYATAAGVGGLGYLLGTSGKSLTKPSYLPTYTPPTAASYGLGRTLSSNYTATRPMAEGGIAGLGSGGSLQNTPANVDFMGGDMYPQSQQHRSYYATPTQAPTGAQQVMAGYEAKTNPLTGEPTANMAFGGLTAAGQTGLQAPSQSINPQYIQQLANQFNTTPAIAQQGLQTLQNAGIAKASGGSVGNKYNLGSYSDGGRLLKGPGDGMSDGIPASIADKQPARLADGEFVVPADVVSHLGNGSTDAGAKHLYKMMDNVRKARTGRKSQGKEIKAGKYLPK